MSNTAHRVRRLTRFVSFASALFVLSGCASVTPIGELLDNSSHYDGKTVRIEGVVQESAGLLGRGAYEVKDNTGKLTVISEGATPPRTGARIGVKGKFQALFTLLSKSLAVLMEQSRSQP
jgi:cytochrome c-type biogenesis protein CcmE